MIKIFALAGKCMISNRNNMSEVANQRNLNNSNEMPSAILFVSIACWCRRDERHPVWNNTARMPALSVHVPYFTDFSACRLHKVSNLPVISRSYIGDTRHYFHKIGASFLFSLPTCCLADELTLTEIRILGEQDTIAHIKSTSSISTIEHRRQCIKLDSKLFK